MTERLHAQSAQPRLSRPAPKYPTLAAAGLALGLLGCGGAEVSSGSAPPPYDASVRRDAPSPIGLPPLPYDASVPEDAEPPSGDGGEIPGDGAPTVDAGSADSGPSGADAGDLPYPTGHP